MIGFALSEDLLEIQARARRFAQEEILPIASEYDRRGGVPPGIVAKARAAGLLNVTIPQEYGGLGYGALQSAIIAEELGAACAGISITILVNGLALTPIQLFGTAEQKERFLRPVASLNAVRSRIAHFPSANSANRPLACLPSKSPS